MKPKTKAVSNLNFMVIVGAGLVGMRPTLGLVSRTGVIPYDIERDTVGVLTRDVSDNALLLSIISGTICP